MDLFPAPILINVCLQNKKLIKRNKLSIVEFKLIDIMSISEIVDNKK